MSEARQRIPAEVVALPLVQVLLVVGLALDLAPLAIVAGLLHVAFVPGYLLVWALFPRAGPDSRGLTGLDRIGLALPISFGVVAGLALLLEGVAGELTAARLAILLLGFELATAVLVAVRLRGVPLEDRWTAGRVGWPAGPAPVAVAACTAVAALSLVAFMQEPIQDEPFTSLALRGDPSSCFPAVYRSGTYVAATRADNGTLLPLPDCPATDEITVLLGNYRGQSESYTVRVTWADPRDGRDVGRSVVFEDERTLDHGEVWSLDVPLGAPSGTGPGFLYVQAFLGRAPSDAPGPLPPAEEEVRLAIERGGA